MGEFNEIIHQNEKSGVALRPYKQMEEFREVIEVFGLSDLGYQGSRFTWRNNREWKNFTKERLDQALANSKWHNLLFETKVTAMVAQTSYHCSLLHELGTMENEVRRIRPFRYEANWARREDYNDIVRKA